MKAKWNGKTINVQNKLSKPSKDFCCTWNDYTIQITYDEWVKRNYKRTEYSAYCYDPNGGACVDGACYPTMSMALQGCFDNIDYPLVKTEDA